MSGECKPGIRPLGLLPGYACSKNMYRLIGIQANGSSLPSSELAKLKQPIADYPEGFSIDLLRLKNKLNLKIIAGCCGTNKEHLAHIMSTYGM